MPNPNQPTKIRAVRKKSKRQVKHGIAHISSTFNNTIITITDHVGNALASVGAGAVGFKGSRKCTPFAAQMQVDKLVDKLKNFGVETLEVLVRGAGSAREAAIRALHHKYKVTRICDVTPVPFNGVRAKKERRV